ncbi:staygreen family protein [Bacillus massiliigorillae]|uniref:staygreen family protein n=1 Tax=Bacillus massiliigorillae TaxID=1243664 RepID=UPI0003A97191|nr:staygreen family protein [Bacillus massiliigorillae]
MTVFDVDKLSTFILPPATSTAPVAERKYTMTHDDRTGNLFVTIGYSFDTCSLTAMRDEVLAEWVPHHGQFALIGKAYVSGGEYDANTAQVRYLIFKKEMETALQAIVNSDRSFFEHFPWFLDFPIYIHFESILPQYNQVINYGTPRSYVSNSFCQSAV